MSNFEINIEGLEGIETVIQQMSETHAFLSSLNEKEVDVGKLQVFLPDNLGPGRLIKNDKNMTAEERAKWIADNPEIDRFLQSITDDVNKRLKG